MSNKMETIGSDGLLDGTLPFKAGALGGEGSMLDPSLIIQSEVVNWGDVVANGQSNFATCGGDTCNDNCPTRPVHICTNFEIC